MSKVKKSQPEFINILGIPVENIEPEIVPVPAEKDGFVEIEVEEIDEVHAEHTVQGNGNLEAAMNKVAETLNLTRKINTGSKPGEPAQRQVLIRASVTDHENWKRTAEIRGVALSELIRELCNIAAKEALECQHPAEFRKTYKWSDTCLKCNTRLRGWE